VSDETNNSLARAALRFLSRAHAVSSPDVFVETLTREIGCDGGELWLMHDDARLRLAGAWYTAEIEPSALRESASGRTCRIGEGLPGRAVTAKGVMWIDSIDPAATSRAPEFTAAGISSAIAVPMFARGVISGVLVFLSRGKELPSQAVLDQLSDIGAVSSLVYEGFRVTTGAAEAETQLVALAATTKAMEVQSAMLRHLADAFAATGPEAFDVLAKELAHAVGIESAMIAAIEPENRVHPLGAWSDGRPMPRVVWNLATPVARMIATGSGVSGAVGAVPCDEPAVLEMAIDGYAAWPLVDSGGNVIGFAAVMSRDALSLSSEQEAMLRIIAGRAAVELERVRMKERAVAAGEQVRALAEAVEDGVITIDDRGVIVGLNVAANRIFGYSGDELLGENVSTLMPEPHASRHDGYLRRHLAVGKPEDLTVRRDLQGRRKDGSTFPLRLTVLDVRLPSRRLFTGILRDLSEVVELRQDLQRSRGVIADTQRLTHIGNWVWDLRTDGMEWSDEIFRIFGRTRSEFNPSFASILECVHPNDRAALQSAVEEGLENGEAGLEHRVLRPDGTEVMVLAHGEVQFEDEQPVRIIGTTQDITDRHNATQSLARLSSAIEQTADHVMITDREGRIEYVNPAFEEATGYSRERVIGETPRILKSGAHNLAFYKNVWNVLLAGDVYRGVFVNQRSDGTTFYEEKTITPIRRADGAITHFVSTGRDISERMRIEKEQENLRNALSLPGSRCRLTFDAIDFPVFVCGSDGVVRRANTAAQKLSGIPFTDLIGRRLEDFPRSQPWVGAAEMVARAAGGEAVSAQVREPVSNRTWELAAMPFTGGPIASLVIFVARDLTDLLELQESLRRTEVMSTLGALVAGVAHEVRNPLFAISATIDAFEGRALDQALFDDYTARLRVELDRLKELMADLLEYGRPADPELRRGTVRASVENALRSTASLAASLDVHIDVSTAGAETAEAMIDERRLPIAFRNLLDNAIRHSGRGGHVELRVERGDGFIEIAVRDRGAGFDAADLPHLFEPFYTRRRGGTGLGLSIVHRTIEQHGGSIVAENHPDGGAVMRVRLPLAERAS